MSHDIIYCSGHDLMGTTQAPIICAKRDTCKRYKLFTMLEKRKSYQAAILLPSNCMNDHYCMYLNTQGIQLGHIHDETDVMPTREGGYEDD